SFGNKRQVSRAGGGQALWRKNGRELFYLSLDGKLMAADVKASSMLKIGPPKVLFQTPVTVNPTIDQYGVTADGQRSIHLRRAARNRNTDHCRAQLDRGSQTITCGRS